MICSFDRVVKVVRASILFILSQVVRIHVQRACFVQLAYGKIFMYIKMNQNLRTLGFPWNVSIIIKIRDLHHPRQS